MAVGCLCEKGGYSFWQSNLPSEKVVIELQVIGTSSGIGRELAYLLNRDGYKVYATYRNTDEAFEALYGALGVDGITDLDAELVLDVLLYHVTEVRRAANSVVPPVRDRTITILLEDATFTVDKEAINCLRPILQLFCCLC